MINRMNTPVTISDHSNDKKYYIMTPQIVWVLSRTPHDFTLWNVVKMVAGEYGQCILSTEDLAIMSMMSAGKVSDSRSYLLRVGAFEGECVRDPGYPQPVWHLRIPDIWHDNIQWRKAIDSLKDRIELKAKLKALFEEADILRRFDKSNYEAMNSLHNVNVKSLHNMKPSQYEGKPSQYEEGIPQYEGKKNHKKNHKEEPGIPEQKQMSIKEPTLPQLMFSALAEICQYDLDIITIDERGMLNQAEKKMRDNGYRPDDLRRFEKWWYANDFRGKQDQPPTLKQIRQTWGQFKKSQKKGQNNEQRTQLSPAAAARARQLAAEDGLV